MRTAPIAQHSPIVLLVVGMLSLALAAACLSVQPALAFTAAVIPASAPPEPPPPSPEIEVSSEPFPQFSAAIAYNWKQDEYLVVWRNAPATGNYSIWARRIATTGALRSPVLEITAAAPNNLTNPAVAYDPVHERYLVVWSELSTAGDWDLFGRFVPWEGPQPTFATFSIVTWITNQWAPHVAYSRGAEEFLVVWANEQAPFWTVNGVRITAASGATVGAPLTISHPSEHRKDPGVAYNIARNEYLVVYDNDQDVFAQRLDATGAALGAEIIPAGWPSTEYAPSVAACSQADHYLVTWLSDEGVNGMHGYVRYIDGDGQLPGSGGPFRVDPRANSSYAPVVSCGVTGPNATGGDYLVTWEAQFGIAPLGVWGRFLGEDFTLGPLFDVFFAEDVLNRWSPIVMGGEGNFLVAGMVEVDHAGVFYPNIHARLVAPYGVALPLVTR